MQTWLLPLILIALAALLLIIAWRYKKASGLPSGRLVYADTDQLQAIPKPFYDPVLNLVGKPDYVIRQKDGSLIPVDFKSVNAPLTPYDSHVYQVLAYCYLIEQTQGIKPGFGIIRYQDKSFEVPYDQQEKAKLLALIEDLRFVENSLESPDRSHHQAARCRSCGYRDICEQSLA